MVQVHDDGTLDVPPFLLSSRGLGTEVVAEYLMLLQNTRNLCVSDGVLGIFSLT